MNNTVMTLKLNIASNPGIISKWSLPLAYANNI